MIRKTAMTILLTAFTSILFLSGCTSDESINNTPLKGTIDLQGHRGARGLRPENTIPAFTYCIENNMTTIEMDTTLTKDKKFIVNHDTSLNGKLCLDTDGTPAREIPIRELTVSEIKTYDCGALQNEDFPQQQPVKNTKLITLDEFFTFIKNYERGNRLTNNLKFNIEIKFDDDVTPKEIKEAARLMVQTLEQTGMADRTTVQCFNLDLIIEVRKLNNNIKTSALFSLGYIRGFLMMIGFDSNRDDIIKQAIDAEADVISPYHLYVTPEFIQKCHKKNLEVLPWTVNERERMLELLRFGTDGIISDYPNILYKTYEEYKNNIGKEKEL